MKVNLSILFLQSLLTICPVAYAFQGVFRSQNIFSIPQFPALFGLRSSSTSDELKQNPQFKANGQWTAGSTQDGLKLSDFLNLVAPSIFSSTTSSKNAIRKGLVRLNGCKPKNTDSVRDGDIVDSFIRCQQGAFCIDSEHKVIDDPSAFGLFTVPVLWEDDHCAVVIKPQGMPVFRTKDPIDASTTDSEDSKGKSPCLQTALPFSLSPLPLDSDLHPLRRPQAVHRLDKGTGGLLLVAKTRPALVNLTAQFSDRTVSKKYKAIVVGKLANSVDEVVGVDPCTAYPESTVNGVISYPLSGQSAETNWSVGRGMQTRSTVHGWITTVDLMPHTGRTHQLRRHMDLLLHPIMGDMDYWFQDGGRLPPFSTADSSWNILSENPTTVRGSSDSCTERERESYPPRLVGRGIYLWSVGISFDHPVTGERMDLSIPEPPSYAQLRADLLS